MSTTRAVFLAGVRAELPILLGVAPFGMIYGALALKAGLPAAAAQAMSAIVFAGSAQFVATQLFASTAPGPIHLLTAFIVNLRHMLYSASVASYINNLPRRWKWLLAYLLTDEAYAVAITHYRRTDAAGAHPGGRLAGQGQAQDLPLPDDRHWFFLGAGLALWVTWQASTAVGIFLGSQVPPGWSLDFTLALTFIALLIPAVVDRPALVAALVAGLVALVGAGWPYKLGLVTAAVAGIAAGALLENRRQTAARGRR